MKKLVLMSLLLAGAVYTFAQQSYTSLALGASVPVATVKMKDISGKEVSIADATKKNGVLVMFSCNTCPYVVKNQERTKEVAAYAAKHNVGVIVINSNDAQRNEADSYEAMKTYAEKQGYKCFYTLDAASKVANAFGATRTPEVFLFNSKGILTYKGAIDDSPADAAKVTRHHLQTAIDETVAGKEVTVKESKSVGCTIKRS